MEELSREKLFLFVINKDNIGIQIPEELLTVLNINLVFLSNLESLFISDSQKNLNSTRGLLDIMQENFLRTREEVNISSALTGKNIYDLNRTVDKLEQLLEYEGKSANVFNKILKLLINWSDSVINDYISDLKVQFKNLVQEIPEKNMNKVFLSYAYEDHLYTLSLFLFFYSKGIYLYIDWMHNDLIDSGVSLKDNLFREMNTCKQLLFLQSINMELNLSGNLGIKPWCAWEIGNFYRKELGKEKYYISIYDKNKKNKNIILEGIEKLSSLNNGVLA